MRCVFCYTTVDKAEQRKFALDVAAKTLPFYKDYFNVPYPLPKTDLVIIADFAAGAMENWGLIIYRETALLIDSKTPGLHPATGLLWLWDMNSPILLLGNGGLWLNEGFVSCIEYLNVDHCLPEYDIWIQFLDALDNSHPIEVSVLHPSKVDVIFDAIPYSKGASVIRILHDYIGDKDFKKGINITLNQVPTKECRNFLPVNHKVERIVSSGWLL
uniref:Peptidase M1 membrane alanine aminopeptidase domain-containing protein n=1 Tax=Vombatus ursinus TaxID=29139 RepID=A0A4X2KSF8_VOMUR